jgi:hypothetical protein
VDDLQHTTQQLFTWGSQRFEVGKDYTVLKSDAQSFTIQMFDKKGHEVKELLDVAGTALEIRMDSGQEIAFKRSQKASGGGWPSSLRVQLDAREQVFV